MPQDSSATALLADATLSLLKHLQNHDPGNKLASLVDPQKLQQHIHTAYDQVGLQQLYNSKGFKRQRCAVINQNLINPYKLGRLSPKEITSRQNTSALKVQEMLVQKRQLIEHRHEEQNAHFQLLLLSAQEIIRHSDLWPEKDVVQSALNLQAAYTHNLSFVANDISHCMAHHQKMTQEARLTHTLRAAFC